MAEEQQTRRRHRRERRFNLRFVLIGLALLVPLGIGVHFLHAFQVRRSSEVLLTRAHELEKQGKLKEAATYYKQYIGLTPGDIEARATLARILDEAADSVRERFVVLQTYEAVLRHDPERAPLRRRVIELWMSPEFEQVSRTRFEDARSHIEYLLKTSPDDGELVYRLGVCRAAAGDYAEAARLYDEAIAKGYTTIDVYVQLAQLMRQRLDQPARADELMQALIEANPDSVQAYLTRAVYRRQHGTPAEMQADLSRAEELDPTSPEVVLLLTQQLLGEADPTAQRIDHVRTRLNDALAAAPPDLRLFQALSQLESKAGQPAQAIAALRRGQAAAPARPELVWLLADSLITSGEVEESLQLIQKLRELKATQRYIDFLSGRIAFARGDLLGAVNLLKPLRSERVANPELARMVNLQLAECYRLMGRHQEQRDVLQSIPEGDLASAEARLGEAAALAALGQLDAALAIYRNYLDLPDAAIATARLMIVRNLQLPPHARDWRAAEEVFKAAAARHAGSSELVALHADMLRSQGKSAEAQELLQSALATETAPPFISIALSRLALQRGDLAAALQILDDAQQRLGDSVALRLARADLWGLQTSSESIERVKQLAGDREQFPVADQQALLEGVATILFRLNDLRAAQDVWRQLTVLAPDNVLVYFRLFNLALSLKDDSSAAKALSRLRAIEGEDGSHLRAAQAVQLIERATPNDRAPLDEARSILRRLATQRPSWALVPLTEARIDELTGSYDAAAEHYEQAIRLGHRDPQILLRAIELLSSRGRNAEAIALFRRAEAEAPLMVTQPIRRLATEISLRSLDFDQALSMAHDAVSENSPDVGDHIWLSRVLSAAGRTAESEESLRKAVTLRPEEPAAWVALVLFLARTKQVEKADAAIAEAQQHLPADQAPLVVGLCQEQLNRFDEAERLYLAAIEQAPQNLELAQNLAAFYLRTRQSAKAEPVLRDLIANKQAASQTDLNWERRVLAMAVAGRDYPGFLDALKLLDENLAATRTLQVEPRELNRLLAVDQRLKARLLASRPNKEMRQQAVEVLEQLNQHEALLPADLQLLSQLYDALDQPDKAAERWGALFTSQQQNPAYVSTHVLRLLGQHKFDEADKWLIRLQKFSPQAFVTVELTARYHLAKQDYELIIPAITAYLDAEKSDTPRADRVSQAVRLYEVLLASAPADSGLAKQITDETDRLYAELVEAQPSAAVAYARFAAGRKRLDQALDLCERALPTAQRTQATATALGIVRAFGNDQQRERVARWLEENVAAEPDSVAALLQLADLRDLQQEYDEAMRHYRRILELDSQNVIALNNLAWLLAVRAGDHAEAERLIDAAIEASGPVAVLLDTQGTVRYSRGNFTGALESFNRSIHEQDQPGTRFHRAQAHHADGDADAARNDLQAALDSGLTAHGLQPLERDAFRQLLAELELPEPGA